MGLGDRLKEGTADKILEDIAKMNPRRNEKDQFKMF